MVNDASIQRTSELVAYSTHLQGFCDSMTKNCTAYSNVMAQKYSELRQIQKIAEEIVDALDKADSEAFHAFAYIERTDTEGRARCMAVYQKAHEKASKARFLLGQLKGNVSVAGGAVRCIIDTTRNYQNKVRVEIEKGRSVLKNSAIKLNQYSEISKNI